MPQSYENCVFVYKEWSVMRHKCHDPHGKEFMEVFYIFREDSAPLSYVGMAGGQLFLNSRPIYFPTQEWAKGELFQLIEKQEATKAQLPEGEELSPQWQPRYNSGISAANVADTENRDKQIGGDHYAKHAIQPWDITLEYGLNYWAGNALEYLLRYKDKGGIQDLRKSIHYIEHLIHLYEEDKLNDWKPNAGAKAANPLDLVANEDTDMDCHTASVVVGRSDSPDFANRDNPGARFRQQELELGSELEPGD